MPPEAGSPGAWLRFARSDLALARGERQPEVLLETLCFHAQQAAEKSIKAVLMQAGIPPPRAHSIERLLGLLPPAFSPPADLLAAAKLTPYATIFRYPTEEEPVSEEEYREAVRLAEAVVAWATRAINP
jgi:HEPN domain-containing protein